MPICLTFLITGPMFSGKTQFLKQLIFNEFDEEHFTSKFPLIAQKSFIHHHLVPAITIVDSDQPRFLARANIALIILDIDKPYLIYNEVEQLKQSLTNKNCLVAIFGNIRDQDEKTVQKFILEAEKYSIVFIGNVKSNIGIQETFLTLVFEYIEKYFVFDCSVKQN